MHSYVFNVSTGEIVGWFADAKDAIAFRTRMTKKFGKDTHDWAHTTFTVNLDMVEGRKVS